MRLFSYHKVLIPLTLLLSLLSSSSLISTKQTSKFNFTTMSEQQQCRSSSRKRKVSQRLNDSIYNLADDFNCESDESNDDDQSISSDGPTQKKTSSSKNRRGKRERTQKKTNEADSAGTTLVSKIFSVFNHDYKKQKSENKLPNIDNVDVQVNQRWKAFSNFYCNFVMQMISAVRDTNMQDYITTNLINVLRFRMNPNHENEEEKMKQGYEDYIKLSNQTLHAYEKADKGSLEKRILRLQLQRGLRVAEQKRLGIYTGHFRDAATRDAKILEMHNTLQKVRYSRKRKEDSVIHRAVKFILSPFNCQPLSFGTKKVVLSETEKLLFPSMMRKVCVNISYEEYVLAVTNKKKRVGETLYRKIAKEITTSDPKILSGIDYVTTKLVNENVEMMQEVIEEMVESGKKQYHFESLLETAKHFTKYQYKLHAARKDDECYTHGLDYALNPSYVGEDKEANCDGCKFPFYVVDCLIKEVKENYYHLPDELVEDAITALENGKLKIALFMGHTCRVIAQQKKIKEILEELKQECIHSKGGVSRAHLLADFKMKFNPLMLREPTYLFFGKKGFVWHGFLFAYYEMVPVEYDYEKGVFTKHEARRVNVYIDQIMDGDTKQDVFAVLSLLEAAMTSINIHFPKIKKISLQSDNAGCYQSNYLLYGCQYLNKKFRKKKLQISQIIHTETQDGKSQLDGHFAQAGN